MGGAIAPAALAASGVLSVPGIAAALVKGSKESERKPNIIFILSDDLGYGDLGCYGQKQVRTPHIDRLAKEGIRFTDFYAGSSVCAPTRCCLMTGYHTGHARIRGNNPPIPLTPLQPEDVTVAKVLKGQGYSTGIIGKWGLGETENSGAPNKQGFDYFFGYLKHGHAHNYYTDHLYRNEKLVKIPAGTYSHDLFTQEALDFVRREQDKPFFLYLAYTIPHANDEVKGNGMQVPSDSPYSDKPWSETERDFAAMVTRMDRDVGRLMALLQDLGLDENTVVFFAGDNGPHAEGGHKVETFDSNGPLRGHKGDPYEGGIRIPMIARWPGKIEAGRESNYAGAFWDVLPTAAKMAGAKPPAGIDGISMLPVMTGHKQREHEYLYWEFYPYWQSPDILAQAVRMGKWKAVRNAQSGPIELYDLEADLGEKTDLAAKHPDVVKSIEDILKTAHGHSDYWPPKPTVKG
jgi:arylsulfatase A-like enzyme